MGMYASGAASDSAQYNTVDLADVPVKLRTSWAQYSPYFPVAEYQSPPENCRITQAHLLQRHGARYPTASAGANIVTAVNKLKSAQNFTDSRLQFLRTHVYELGADDLVPYGARESELSGRVQFGRYSHLVTKDQLPFVRAAGSDRVILSATNWTAGFAKASNHLYSPVLSVIISEEAGQNNTLDTGGCPKIGSSTAQTNEWLLKYGPPIADRLNTQAPGAKLTPTDAYNLLSLCAFESVHQNRLSPFCNVFSQEEFEQFEYSGDLDKYYKTGYGQPLGPAQGIGYVNELLARLTGTPVRDNTKTNHTLTGSPVTFPLHRAIYADFSHDNEMVGIYAALGLFKQKVAPNPSSPDPNRNWLASQLVPFGARMVTEKLACGAEEYVRIFVNDARQPLEFCGGDKNGLCTLKAFVESQSYSRTDGNGDWAKCF
ncbi:hypothetical protein H0H81_009054 [Sphagnurus paluster]|uniref:Phytase A n=1 Tax=Sphagnurus paluster TaxID=117069 RepID=A0A9P7FPL5_9AGAR|nr:hypothetical protein H0H81_009054 [Sphagnurus paluster]